jgi:dimethylglycine dehydrogenase
VARYGDWTTLAYTNAKVRENYSRRFSIRFPNEELPAARPSRTTPIYEKLQAQHAVFGDYCALEHALWFAPTAREAVDEVSFRRSNAHPHVAAECKAVQNAVGLLEISNYGKFDIRGPGTAEWLSHMMANRVPAVGRIALTPMLNDRGKLIGDFTMCRVSEEQVFLVGTYAAETYYMRWFERHMPATGVSVRPCAMEYVGLSVAGPHSRALLQTLVRDDLSTSAFPFMSFRRMEIGMVPGYVGRVSFTGDLGYEIWVTTDYQRALYDALVNAGREFGLKLFGGRALNAMRIEKSFGSWAREYRPIYGPFEAGLDRFVDFKKPAFIGRSAAAEEKESGGALRLVTLQVDAADADAIGDEPIWHDGKAVGWVTSGAFGHRVGRSLALGYVPAALSKADTGFEVEIIGERHAAQRLPGAAFDPGGKLMRQ